jgi:O-antigen ligase
LAAGIFDAIFCTPWCLEFMSRFKPDPRSAPRPEIFTHPVALAKKLSPAAPKTVQPGLASTRVNTAQKIGFAMLCVYAVGPYLNEIGGRFFGITPRITLVPLLLLLLCTVFSGQAARALQMPIGRWWLAMFVIMIVATPFSFWPGGSVAILQDFGLKRYIVLFFICAVQASAIQCIRFAYVNVLSMALILFLCFRYGIASEVDGRFFIADSLFFDNPNDLAIGLLIAATSLLFVFFASSFPLKMMVSCEITLAIFYILKTGSRGTFLATVAAGIFAIVFAKKRLFALVLIPMMLAALIAFVPAKTMQRLMNIVINAQELEDTGTASSDVESQLQRQDTLKRSLSVTLTHPLLGVGPGMFDNFVQQRAKAANVHTASIGTHNSYTQISSECGIPALICYLATLILTMKLYLRTYKELSKRPIDSRLTGIAFSGFIGTIAYIVASTFHHIAYGGALPSLGGQAIALWLATRPALQRV